MLISLNCNPPLADQSAKLLLKIDARKLSGKYDTYIEYLLEG